MDKYVGLEQNIPHFPAYLEYRFQLHILPRDCRWCILLMDTACMASHMCNQLQNKLNLEPSIKIFEQKMV